MDNSRGFASDLIIIAEEPYPIESDNDYAVIPSMATVLHETTLAVASVGHPRFFRTMKSADSAPPLEFPRALDSLDSVYWTKTEKFRSAIARQKTVLEHEHDFHAWRAAFALTQKSITREALRIWQSTVKYRREKPPAIDGR